MLIFTAMILNSCLKEAVKVMPTITIADVTDITSNSAKSGGNISSNGGEPITARGVCWSTNQNPTTDDYVTNDGADIGHFTSSITSLTSGTTYYIKAYAINSVGTAYSNQLSFTTLYFAPVLTTTNISAITATSAISGGNITNDGGNSITSRGVCWSSNQIPTTADSKTTDGTGTGIFTSSITGLTPGTTYYVRAYAINDRETIYGNDITFTTLAPVLTTNVISAITTTSAISGGNISSDGGATIIERGVCWSTSSMPTTTNSKTTDGSGTGTFVSSLSGLASGTLYYVRAYATNTNGTAYGNQLQFTTSGPIFNPNLTYGTVNDIDGNSYKTIQIGTQTWMAENLKTTKYRDNIFIPLITNPFAWSSSITPAYCWYNNDAETYKDIYGALYNWYTVNTGKLCPTGWHVPNNEEWLVLETFIGGFVGASIKLKEKGTAHWYEPNDATNETGFTALPAGRNSVIYGSYGSFSGRNTEAYFWSSSVDDTNYGSVKTIVSRDNNFGSQNDPKFYGHSVRCVKD